MTKVFSMFSGIGGFELGLLMSEKKVKLVGFSEVDKYAIEVFEKQFKGIKNYGNATTIDETKLPNFDLLVGGFPCQAFSVAGKLRGFNDTRGTLFFDVARILAHKKPKHFILENVRGLLSHDNGRTMQTILKVLADIGYLVQWEVLNSKNYGVPQNRERVYIIGHLRGSSRPKIFPIRQSEEVSDPSREEEREGNSEVSSTITSNYKRGVHAMGEQYIMEPKELTKDISMAYRVYDSNGLSTTLKAVGGGVGAKTGLYQVGVVKDHNKLRETENSTCIDANYWKGLDNHAQRTGVEVRACLTPDRAEKRQNGRRFKDNEEPMFTLTGQDKHGVMIDSSIRRLTPTECERLQGFPDGWTEGISDTQRYKCLGNAVTTNVVCEIAKRLLK